MRLFIGVDPGNSGGVAAVDDTSAAVRVWKMPATDQDMVLLFDEIRELGDCHAMVERISAAPRRQITQECKYCHHTWSMSAPMNSPKTMLVMGTNYGLMLGGLIAARIPTRLVTASVWQRRFSLVFSRDRNFTTTQKKNKHKECAQLLFPEVKVTHYVADALLIADYCRQMEMNAPRNIASHLQDHPSVS